MNDIDNLVVGNVEVIDNVIAALEGNGMALNIMAGLQDHLSCKIKFSMDEKKAWLGQPHFIKNLNKQLGTHFKDVHNHTTPGAPKFLLVKPMVESKKIFAKDQQSIGWV